MSPEERISSISKEMSAHYRAVKPGDTIVIGLEADPHYPFGTGERPRGVVEAVEDNIYGRSITVDFNGHKETLHQTELGPGDVWQPEGPALSRGNNEEVGSTQSAVDTEAIYGAVQDLSASVSALSQSTEKTTGLLVEAVAHLAGDVNVITDYAMKADGISRGAQQTTFSRLLHDAYMEHGNNLPSRGTTTDSEIIKDNALEMFAQAIERAQGLLEKQIEYRSTMVPALQMAVADVARLDTPNPNSFARNMMARTIPGFNYLP